MPAGCVIGVDLGGTKLLAGAWSQGALVARTRRTVAGLGREELLDAVAEAVRALGVPYDAAGFGIPARLDRRRSVAAGCIHLPLSGVDFAAEMRKRLRVPVAVDNDATCAMLAEARLGAARGTRWAVLLTLGTGIGGGLWLDGRLARGAVGAAGEIGHMTIAADGPPCAGDCPGHGCLETFVSGPALARESGQESGERATELALAGDADACAAVHRMGGWLGVGIASIVNLLNPERVVIGGGVSALGELLLEPARATVQARALAPSRELARIVAAELGADAGLVGAALLALEEAA